MKKFLRQISALRLERLSKDLGLQARSPKAFVVDEIANYCASYGLNSADLMARWPDLLENKQ